MKGRFKLFTEKKTVLINDGSYALRGEHAGITAIGATTLKQTKPAKIIKIL